MAEPQPNRSTQNLNCHPELVSGSSHRDDEGSPLTPTLSRRARGKKVAFTLAEMMVVLLILTICLAAFAPLMTKRRTVDISSPWRYSSNNSDIYYGMGSTQTAMIGQNSKSADDNARLIINTTGNNQRQAIFKQAGTKVGELHISSTNYLLSNGAVNTSGYALTAFGQSALANNTTGYGNTAYGSQALTSNTSGAVNTAIGYYALLNNSEGNNNTAVGTNALRVNTTGEWNTAIGINALYNSTTGHGNVALGSSACWNIVTGSYKTCLGMESGPPSDDPSTKPIVYLGSRNTQEILTYVPITVYSDKRLKDVKEEYKKGLEQIRDVVPKLFVYKSDKEKNVRLGVIAQELQKTLPEAVVKNGDGYLIVHQEYIQYALLNAVKQLDKIMQSLITEVKTMVAKLSYHDNKIKKLEQECADLKQENNAMKQENTELKARLEKLEKFVF